MAALPLRQGLRARCSRSVCHDCVVVSKEPFFKHVRLEPTVHAGSPGPNGGNREPLECDETDCPVRESSRSSMALHARRPQSRSPLRITPPSARPICGVCDPRVFDRRANPTRQCPGLDSSTQ